MKLFVAAKYLDHKERLGGLWPVVTKVAAECRVGLDFVVKIERELMENERILAPEEIYLACNNPIGPGSRSMSKEDFFLLYILYRQQEINGIKRSHCIKHHLACVCILFILLVVLGFLFLIY